tara:strand:- start:70 stop:1200 length:1131 start_codon:yes stop_codon:yes gene_type:complete
MASLKNRRGNWYARVLWYEEQKKKEKQIPLRTESKVTARERLSRVNQVEDEIIELHYKGEKYSFPWMNKDGKRKVVYLTLEEAVEKWLRLRKAQGLADSTLERNRGSMDSIMSLLGKSKRLKNITTSDMDDYIERMELKGYSGNGININLRAFRTFLKWAERRNHIDKMPYVEKAKVDDTLPSYLNDSEFDEMLSHTNEFYKKVFTMYRSTGFRLMEPILGTLKNDTLVIPARYSKTRKERRILLNADDVPVIYELQEYYETWRNKVKVNKPKYFGDKISKEFRRINRLVGLTNKFHDLRHTFAVRRYLMTRDIYQVMRELGHTKVTTTQMYADFEDTVDIEKEFPSIVNTSNEPIFGKVDTNLVDTNKVGRLYVS